MRLQDQCLRGKIQAGIPCCDRVAFQKLRTNCTGRDQDWRLFSLELNYAISKTKTKIEICVFLDGRRKLLLSFASMVAFEGTLKAEDGSSVIQCLVSPC